ncbi:hypothetical protein M1N89_02295, partial [Dehalococcoidia bacterium]|nr:hypothetical protein [Dehalococcoidia bacterium]
EFGFKGLGSKLMYLSRKLEIDTRTASGESYKVIIDDPIGNLMAKEPSKPRPIIYRDAPLSFQRGTVIRVLGYDRGIKYVEYENPDKLKQYLYFRTAAGYTRSERAASLPRIIVNTPAIADQDFPVGFPWIRKEGSHEPGQKIGIIDPPIQISKDDGKGNKVTILLRGGYALRTGEFGMPDYGIMESMGVGLTYVWKGIPLFNLDFNRYKPEGFDLYYKFCRFVVECDDIETDIARSRIVADGIKAPLFDSGLREAFRRVTETEDYKDWVRYRRDLRKKELGSSLNQRKDELQRKDQRWVYFKGDLIHKEPRSEEDTRALLWKLEGMKALPFHYFRTLEHTAQKGIDVIGEFQEKDFSEKKLFQALEVEHILENYSDHDHVPEQTSMIVAWDSRDKNKLTRTEVDWKYVWEYAGQPLTVFLLKYVPGIDVRTKE